jgi:hypothetical protein
VSADLALIEVWTAWDRSPADRARVVALQAACEPVALLAGVSSLDLRRRLTAERRAGATPADAVHVVLEARAVGA